jgi:hypothetical protein
MKTKYFTCEEWISDKSFHPVLMKCESGSFLLMRNGKKIRTVNSKRTFMYGDKLREISEAEVALLI